MALRQISENKKNVSFIFFLTPPKTNIYTVRNHNPDRVITHIFSWLIIE